jgi:diadenosine tetraphosphatase ApaH/serine/threonine PP2A family protein phosphatase
MRYLIISDIHANLEALEAVMAASAEERIDATLVLGDLVGYGADPNAVVARVRAMPATTIIRGNHDKVGAGIDDVEGFNPLAKHAIEWTAAVLTPENRRWLAALPAGPTLVNPVVEICHGAPFDEDCYLFDELDVRRALASMQRPLCLFGHTHVPAAFRQGPRFEIIGPPRGETFEIALEGGGSYLVNCGAVGQPRDGDPRAAFGVFETEARRLVVRRVPYDVMGAQAKIVGAGLPEVLAQRLAFGR